MTILAGLTKAAPALNAVAPYASLASGILGSVFSKEKKPSRQQRLQDAGDAQYVADYNSIKGKVLGAKRFGLHPLAALGIGTAGSQVVGNFQGGIEGQNLGRAIGANINGFRDAQMFKLTLERARLENELLETQISNINNQPGDPPVVPLPSQPVKPVSPEDPARQGGAITKSQYVRRDDNTLSLVPSKEMKERMEDDIIQQLKYHGSESFPFSKTRIKRYFKSPPYPSEIPPPKGKKWVWYPHKNEWRAK